MNQMKLEFASNLENESFVRTSVVAFLMPLNLTMNDVMEIKTILAEGVVNAMIHGYANTIGMIMVAVSYDEEEIQIEIRDEGEGIADSKQAMQPLYTSKEELERSGMGFTIMQTFADEFDMITSIGKGTSLYIKKRIKHGNIVQ
ncbi:MAG: anti-sigma F factor [Longicatena sp.]